MAEPREKDADSAGDEGSPPPEIIDDAPTAEERPSRDHGSDASGGGGTGARGRLSSGGLQLGESADDLRIVEKGAPSGEEDELILTPADSGSHRVPRAKPSMVLAPDDGDEDGAPSEGGEREARRAKADRSALSREQLQEIETLVSRGQWQQICKMLGPPETAASLPPALQVVYGVARKENAPPGEPTSDTDALTITAMARLLGVPQESPLALVLAKRALRSKRPWAKREAPRGPLTILILIIGLGLGGLVGWWATFML